HRVTGRTASPAAPRHRPHRVTGRTASPAAPRHRPHRVTGRTASPAAPRHRPHRVTGRTALSRKLAGTAVSTIGSQNRIDARPQSFLRRLKLLSAGLLRSYGKCFLAANGNADVWRAIG
ncbi:hypothetical protein, partial [Actinoplanes sp. NPDC026619]|uniref:hypothetical protein n=1 Tax=Actinoplanes sp. NPDC026619 TaxID=3155798 RepID=UPI00340D15C2